MDNFKKYNFNDFTFSHYRELIEYAKFEYSFITYDQLNHKDNFILWRHDVDMSLHNALSLSEIEKDLNVVATYFIHLHSEFYNFFDEKNTKIIRDIINNGHKIGLHFDCQYYKIKDAKELELKILFEKNILENIFSISINVFSFHNPNSDILKFDNTEYADLINTYGKQFKEINYCSDSNGYWRHKRLKDFLEENKGNNIQVLTHPEWWNQEILSPKQRIWKVIDNNGYNLKKDYDIGILKNNRKNIDW